MSTIAIIGASYLQLPAVLKAKEMGHKVICFAWADGAVCKEYADRFYPVSITDKAEILKICKEENIDAVTTVASDLAVCTVNYVASNLGLISNPYEWTEATTNKYRMRECFRANNIPSPAYLRVTSKSQIIGISLEYPVIVKPTDRSGSKGIFKVNRREDLDYAVDSSMQEGFAKEVMIEEFIDGREISVESISFNKRHYIIQITDKVTTGAPHFVELEHHQPSSLDNDTKNEVKRIVTNALDSLHIQFGASHSELKISPAKGIKIIEIGARGGGDFIASNLVQLSTGYDFMKAIIDVAIGEFNYPVLENNKYSGVYFLSKETEHLLPVFRNLTNFPQIIKSEITDECLRNISCSGDRSGYLIYQSDEKLNLKSKND